MLVKIPYRHKGYQALGLGVLPRFEGQEAAALGSCHIPCAAGP